MIYKDSNGAPSALPDPLVAAIAEAIGAEAATERTERVRSRLFARIHAQSPLLAPAPTQPSTPAPTQPSTSPPMPPPTLAAAASNAFITLPQSMTSDGWIEMLPKAHAKLLFTDGEAESYMIRLEPGAWAPAHEHPADEECLVLEGSLWQGDVFLKAGDFHVARPGMKHGELRTDTGALVFIRYGKPLAEYLKM